MFAKRFKNPLRLMADVLSALLLLMILAFAIGEGAPSLARLTEVELLAFAGFAAMVLGLLLAFWRETAGGLLTVLGFLYFWGVNIAYSGRVRLGGAFFVFLLAGTLHLASAWRSRLKPA